METKKTSKKSLKIAENSVAPLAAPEAPVPASKPVKRTTAASSKSTAKVSSKPSASKPSTPTNSSHRHSKSSPMPASSINYEEVARLAYKYWEERNYAHGFADEDWHRAEKTLSARA